MPPNLLHPLVQAERLPTQAARFTEPPTLHTLQTLPFPGLCRVTPGGHSDLLARDSHGGLNNSRSPMRTATVSGNARYE